MKMRRYRAPYTSSSYTGRKNKQNIQLQPADNLGDILHQVAIALSYAEEYNLPMNTCLLYLNNAVTLIRPSDTRDNCNEPQLKPLENDESWKSKRTKILYYRLLRCALLHKSKVVRAGGLRLLRYITYTEEDVQCLEKANLIPLICRCIDQHSQNHSEREHGVRLARHLVQMTPSVFPPALARCLVAIARDGNKENDRLLKAVQATLNELVVLNPNVFIKVGGVSCFLNGILQCPFQRINEALLSGLLYLINSPEYRPQCRQFHRILAPLSDLFTPTDEKEKEIYEQKVQAGYMAALTAFRSWAGFITLYQPKDNALQSIIQMLSLPNEEAQNKIITFLYDLFRIPCGSWHNDYASALAEHTRLTSVDPDAWKLQEGFIVAEGSNSLPHIAKYRPNLIKNYFTLVLHTFIQKGLFQALCKVIVSTSSQLSIRTTLLLGELLQKNNRDMPLECAAMPALPILIEKASGPNLDERSRANQSIEALLKLSRHFVAKQKGLGMSLYLIEILKPEKLNVTQRKNCKISKWLGKDHDEQISHALRSSKIIYEDMSWKDWKWTLLLTLVTWPSSSLHMVEESSHKIMVTRLVDHFKPSSQKFSQLDLSNHRTKIQAKTLLGLCQFLLNVPQGPLEQYLTDLLRDIAAALEDVAIEMPSHDSYFSPSNINGTASQYYFLAIGNLVQSWKGHDAVLKANIFTQLFSIAKVSIDMYSKLIATSMSYTIAGENRKLLIYILTKGHVNSRIYATQLLRVFARAGLPDFSKWGIQLLVDQLSDENKLVGLSALNVLDEALDDEECLEAVLKETPSVPHLGDEGQLLLAKIVGSPHGFSVYHDCKFISTLLDKWANSFNVKYVRLMQIALSESLTHLQRGDDGMYGRRTGSKHIVHDVFLLPHLYGSLTLHEHGFNVLVQHEHISELLKIINQAKIQTSQDIIQLKAAIWAIGHIGRSNSGVKFICSENMIEPLSNLASTCSVYSVRGAVFFAFCMMATTAEGANALKSIGWETVRRHHKEDRQEGASTIVDNKFPSPNYLSDNIEDEPMKSNFYLSEDDLCENISILTDDMDDIDTPVKSRTLPHDSRPPCFNHKRSRSDCAPVIEELGIISNIEPIEEFFPKKASRLKRNIFSSFRKKAGKRRDSSGSKASNSSSTSDRIVSFFKRGRRYKRSERSSGTDEDSSHSQTLTDPHVSDDDTRETESLHARPPLSPIASGASLSTNDVPVNQVTQKSSSINVPRRRTTNSMSSYPGYGLPIRVVSSYRRGVSESEELTSKNSLRDFLASSNEKSSSLGVRGLYEGRMVKSSSGCSDLSSIRSMSMLTSRGSASNLLNRPYHVTTGPPSAQCYMGLCLPMKPDTLLLDESANTNLFPTDFKTTTPEIPNTEDEKIFEFHSIETCLHCSCSKETDEENLDEIDPLKDDRIYTRKEILKLVNGLGISTVSTINQRSSSQKGLFELKHRCPQAYQDVCLYTEICGILSHYPYRLSARRSIQELFSDLEFTNVYKRAREEINGLDVSITESTLQKLSGCSSKKPLRMSEHHDEIFDDFDNFQYIESDP